MVLTSWHVGTMALIIGPTLLQVAHFVLQVYKKYHRDILALHHKAHCSEPEAGHTDVQAVEGQGHDWTEYSSSAQFPGILPTLVEWVLTWQVECLKVMGVSTQCRKLVVMPKHNGQLFLCMHTCLWSRQIDIDWLTPCYKLVPSLYPPRKPMSPLWTITVPQKVLWHTSRLRYNHIYCRSLKSTCTQPAPTNACINRPKLVVGVQLTGCGLSLQFLAVSLLSSTRYGLSYPSDCPCASLLNCKPMQCQGVYTYVAMDQGAYSIKLQQLWYAYQVATGMYNSIYHYNCQIKGHTSLCPTIVKITANRPR